MKPGFWLGLYIKGFFLKQLRIRIKWKGKAIREVIKSGKMCIVKVSGGVKCHKGYDMIIIQQRANIYTHNVPDCHGGLDAISNCN